MDKVQSAHNRSSAKLVMAYCVSWRPLNRCTPVIQMEGKESNFLLACVSLSGRDLGGGMSDNNSTVSPTFLWPLEVKLGLAGHLYLSHGERDGIKFQVATSTDKISVNYC